MPFGFLIQNIVIHINFPTLNETREIFIDGNGNAYFCTIGYSAH